jgi:hypothetical protein
MIPRARFGTYNCPEYLEYGLPQELVRNIVIVQALAAAAAE